MRITVRREHAHNDVALAAGRRPDRRRFAGLAAGALMLGLVTGVGVVPGSTGAAFGAQVQADDACIPILPGNCPAPDPVPDPDPVPAPDPPKTAPKPTKKASPKPSVAAPKKHRKRRHHPSNAAKAPASTPSAVTSPAVVGFAPVGLRSPKKKSAASRPKLKMFVPPVTPPSPSSDAIPVAAVQEDFRPVSAEPRTGHGLLWFAVADMTAIALLVGGSLWRRRRLGPQW
jgi:hypothetical protein